MELTEEKRRARGLDNMCAGTTFFSPCNTQCCQKYLTLTPHIRVSFLFYMITEILNLFQ